MAKSILLVDDSQFVLDMTSFAVSSAGYDVFTALSGFEALELLIRNPMDLCIADINMPGMDGYTLIKKIRKDQTFGEIPILIVSTESSKKDMEKGLDAGANGYLIKPVSPEELTTRIHLLIGDAHE